MSLDKQKYPQLFNENSGNRIVLSHNGLQLIGELKRNSIEERQQQNQAAMLLAQSRWQESRVNRIKALEPTQDSDQQQEQLRHLLLEQLEVEDRQNKYVLRRIENVATKAARFRSTPIDLHKNSDRNNSRSSIITEANSYNVGVGGGSTPGRSSLFPGIGSPKRQRTNKSNSSMNNNNNNKTSIFSESPSTLPVISPQEIRKNSRTIERRNDQNIFNSNRENNSINSQYHKRYSSNDSFAIENSQFRKKQQSNEMVNQGKAYDQDSRQSLNTIWQQNKHSKLTNSNQNNNSNTNPEEQSHRSNSMRKHNVSGIAPNNVSSNVSFLTHEGSYYNNSVLFNSPSKPTEEDSSFSKQYSFLLNAESSLGRMLQRKHEAESVYQRIQCRLKQKMKTYDEQLDGSQADSSDIKTHITDKDLLEPLFRTTNYQARFQNRLRQRQHEKFETHWNVFHLAQKKQQIVNVCNEGMKQRSENSQNTHKKLGVVL